jgi:hypothetical protein
MNSARGVQWVAVFESTFSVRSRGLAWLTRTLLILALLAMLFYLVVLLVYARSVLSFPFDYDQGEGFELYDAVRLARGENIYLDNAAFPYYASNYPPVFRVLLLPLIALLGSKLWVARAFAFACTLVLGVVVFLAARRRFNETAGAHVVGVLCWLLPLLTALALFAANYVYHIAPLARAHMPMVLFAAAGIACLERGLRAAPHKWWTVLGIALLITAGFTKLQAIDALAAGFAFLLIRQWRWGTAALLISGATSALIVAVIDRASGGQFWLNVVAANVNAYDITQTWLIYGQWFRLQAVLIVCGALYVLGDVRAAIGARSLRPIGVWSLYFVCGCALGLLTGKWGAGPTYLIASIVAACVCTAGLFGRCAHWLAARADARWTHALAPLVACAFLLQAWLNLHLPTTGRLFGPIASALGVGGFTGNHGGYPYYDAAGYTQLGHLLDAQDTKNGWALVEELKKHSGPIWSEEAMLTLWAGKDVVTNPTQLYNLSKNDMLDTRDMIARLRRREFGAVVFRAQFYPDDVKAVISEQYGMVGSIRINGFEYFLLLPRPAP